MTDAEALVHLGVKTLDQEEEITALRATVEELQTKLDAAYQDWEIDKGLVASQGREIERICKALNVGEDEEPHKVAEARMDELTQFDDENARLRATVEELNDEGARQSVRIASLRDQRDDGMATLRHIALTCSDVHCRDLAKECLERLKGTLG